MNRRDALAAMIAVPAVAAAEPAVRLATFQAEVTPPIGHPLMGGGIPPAKHVEDPLWAIGFVLLGAGEPIVVCVVDWCEIRNDAYDRWRQALADATGTRRERVLVSSVHQHDAPIADLTAEALLRRAGVAASICDPAFVERAAERVAAAARQSLNAARTVTHLGMGEARVEEIASNRRYLRPDGTVSFDRMSATRDAAARAAGEGTIDPILRTLSFWDERGQPIAALSSYATHPMSYYGRGGVSADFVGLARRRRQADDPSVLQIYASGCSGNVTAGKYNDGADGNRGLLADRLYQAMRRAWRNTRKEPLGAVRFSVTPLVLPARGDAEFQPDALLQRLANGPRPFDRCLAALGLSWLERRRERAAIDLPLVDFGPARLLLLPAESYVEYQLLAQRLSPSAFVLTAGYGECAPGYIPTERAFEERDSNLRDWCWVGRGSEAAFTAALRAALQVRPIDR